MSKSSDETRSKPLAEPAPQRSYTGPATTRGRSLQTLAYEEIKSSPEKPHEFTAVVLHGLLGSGRNWRSFLSAHSLHISLPPVQWRLILVDLRNHGNSAEIEGLLPPHNLENAAKDVANLVKSEGWDWPDVVIGHSMGGKVALQFAQSCAEGHYGDNVSLPKQVRLVYDGMIAYGCVKLLQNSYGWLVDHMLKLGFSKSLSEWIGSNLKKSADQVTWAFNLDGAVQMLNSYREMDYWPLLEHTPNGMEIAVVRAEKSDRWQPDVVQQLERVASKRVGDGEGKVSVHLLPNAGHWVHVDNPKGLLEIVAPKVASVV
ncbi:alpha/beta hydrolase domain-containing protein 11 [Phtheirospermum japonicum]|uniref:Alpha/beta hydrolase domain-containing protein 11 n=1 Tax=Phtheirospermum japonicum TaxID=374723 RepID=A0A830D2K5_9LAMI|nr:alpha/beta hydrolase domain-containing protein 11 [Phtheirospermum japonicum]